MTPGGFPRDTENVSDYAFAKIIPFYSAKESYFPIRKKSFRELQSKDKKIQSS